MVGLEAQVQPHRQDEHERVGRRSNWSRPSRRARSRSRSQPKSRRDEAAAAIRRHESQQREAEVSLGARARRDCRAARESAEARLATRDREPDAASGARRARLGAAPTRSRDCDEASRELEARIAGRTADIQRTEVRRARASRDRSSRPNDCSTRTSRRFDGLESRDPHARRAGRRHASRVSRARSGRFASARHELEGVRAEVGAVEVARARAVADLSHLAAACLEAVGLSLDEVVAAVTSLRGGRRTGAAGQRARPADRRGRRRGGLLTRSRWRECRGRRRGGRHGPDEIIALLQQANRAAGAGQHDGHRAIRRTRVTRHSFLTDPTARPARLDRADRRGHPQDRQDDARAVRRSVRIDQSELRGYVRDAVWRRACRADC